MHTTLIYLTAISACTLFATSVSAQSAKAIRGPSPLVAIENEAAAKLIVDPQLPEQLALRLAFIQYRTENQRAVRKQAIGKEGLKKRGKVGGNHGCAFRSIALDLDCQLIPYS
jgi:hypothetical protein